MASPGRGPPPRQNTASGLPTQHPRFLAEARGSHGGEILTEKEPSEQTNPAPQEPLSPLVSDTLPAPQLRMKRGQVTVTAQQGELKASESHRKASQAEVGAVMSPRGLGKGPHPPGASVSSSVKWRPSVMC